MDIKSVYYGLKGICDDINDFRNRNKYANSYGDPIVPNRINVRGYKTDIDLSCQGNSYNCGDELSKVVVNWMLGKKQLSIDTPVLQSRILVAVGSHFFFFYDDATIWGAGVRQIMRRKKLTGILHSHLFQHLDIRSVRGPLTREYLIKLGHDCPDIYGDPAILMPLIYMPKSFTKDYDILIIPNYMQEETIRNNYSSKYHIASMNTNNYCDVIDSIVKSKMVIASSLHAIILAETYGVPSIFYRFDKSRDIKYLDWYYSTGRYDVSIHDTIESALKSSPMSLPKNISEMQKQIMDVFPYDLWSKNF